MSKSRSPIREVAFTSLGIVLAASVSAASPAAAKSGQEFGASLARVQSALKAGDLRFGPLVIPGSAVDGSHAIRTAQTCPRGSGLYSAGGARRCVAGFAQ